MLKAIPRLIALSILYFCLVRASSVLTDTNSSPVNWQFASALADKGEYELRFTASISKGWHIYSQNMNGDGPVATSITITPAKNFKLVGKTKEPVPHEKYDPNFDMNVKWFDNQVTFTQKIKPVSKTDFKVEGFVTYMTCDDTKCLPPVDVSFAIPVKISTSASSR